MQKSEHVSRRRFLKTAATAAAAFTIVPRHVLGGGRFVAPSDRVNIALVGAGGQGRSNLRKLFEQSDAQVVAIADPAESFSLEKFYYKGVAGREPVRQEIEKHYGATQPGFQCQVYEDFRELLDKEKGVDAVLCATPDHVHAYVSVNCMRAGKHVYCEKPLTHNIWEARLVARIAQETGVATQMGNQGHSTDGIRETCEWIWDGAIGPVREVHAWVSGNRWNPTLASKPTSKEPAPTGLNWDHWLGPRAERPFHSAYFPVAWRDFWDFGGTNIGDFGCHDLDAACWALHLQSPDAVEFHPASVMDKDIAPHGSLGYYQFSAQGEQAPVKVVWYDGGIKPPRPASLPPGESLPSRGVLFIGEQGEMLCGGAGGAPRLLPEEKMKSYQRPAQRLPRSPGHHRDWLDACKGGKPASSHFGYGARLTEIALLGVLALRSGRRIDWDAEAMKARGFDEADRFIREDYRAGWELG